MGRQQNSTPQPESAAVARAVDPMHTSRESEDDGFGSSPQLFDFRDEGAAHRKSTKQDDAEDDAVKDDAEDDVDFDIGLDLGDAGHGEDPSHVLPVGIITDYGKDDDDNLPPDKEVSS